MATLQKGRLERAGNRRKPVSSSVLHKFSLRPVYGAAWPGGWPVTLSTQFLSVDLLLQTSCQCLNEPTLDALPFMLMCLFHDQTFFPFKDQD